MGYQLSQSKLTRESSFITPFYGIGPVVPVADKNAALILSLAGRGPNQNRTAISVTMDSEDMSTTMYYAYPVSYGQATFQDITPGDFSGPGGWSGAHGDNGGTDGPITVPVTINGVSVDFYLYETDWPNLGLTDWQIT